MARIERTRAAGLVAAGVLASAVGVMIWGGETAPAAAPSPGLPVAGRTTPDAEWVSWTAPGLTNPRCVRVDAARERVYVLGTDGSLHCFDLDGHHLGSHALPLERDGNPQGLAIDADGNLLVADTHASRLLRLTPEAGLLASYGRLGDGAGEFHWPTAVAEAADRTLWATEYSMTFPGTHDRLHHLRADGTPIGVCGGTGSGPGQFYRPSNIAIAADGAVWVADACNHRLQVWSAAGEFQRVVDGVGAAGGRLCSPYDLVFDQDGTLLVAEFGASRVRRFRTDGSAVERLIGPGRGVGQVATPWGCAPAGGLLLVADTGNGRLQARRARSAGEWRTAARRPATPGDGRAE